MKKKLKEEQELTLGGRVADAERQARDLRAALVRKRVFTRIATLETEVSRLRNEVGAVGHLRRVVRALQERRHTDYNSAYVRLLRARARSAEKALKKATV